MIKLTRLSGSAVYVNSDQIATVEDIREQTIVELATGKRLMVAELSELVVNKVISDRRQEPGEVVPVRFEVWAAAGRNSDPGPPVSDPIVHKPHKRPIVGGHLAAPPLGPEPNAGAQ